MSSKQANRLPLAARWLAIAAAAFLLLAFLLLAFMLYQYFHGPFWSRVSDAELRQATLQARQCNASSQCVMAERMCGEQVAVNSSQRDNYLRIAARHDRGQGCPLVNEVAIRGFKFDPVCESGQCQAAPSGARASTGSPSYANPSGRLGAFKP